ncbi:MAG: hypothetical protein ABIP51_18005 [Bacteroidia bacterium]
MKLEVSVKLEITEDFFSSLEERKLFIEADEEMRRVWLFNHLEGEFVIENMIVKGKIPKK